MTKNIDKTYFFSLLTFLIVVSGKHYIDGNREKEQILSDIGNKHSNGRREVHPFLFLETTPSEQGG